VRSRNAKHTWVYDTLFVGRIGDTIEDLMERELFKLRNIVHSSPPPFARVRYTIHFRYTDFAKQRRTRHARVTRPSLTCNVYHKAQISDVASW
jgi:hypothetical protein